MEGNAHKDASSGHESHGVHICHRCGWPFPNPHPSAKHRRSHKKICGTIEGFKLSDPDSHSHLADSDDERVSGEDKNPPSPVIEKRGIGDIGRGGFGERSNRSADEAFIDAVTEFSDGGLSPRMEEPYVGGRDLDNHVKTGWAVDSSAPLKIVDAIAGSAELLTSSAEITKVDNVGVPESTDKGLVGNVQDEVAKTTEEGKFDESPSRIEGTPNVIVTEARAAGIKLDKADHQTSEPTKEVNELSEQNLPIGAESTDKGLLEDARAEVSKTIEEDKLGEALSCIEDTHTAAVDVESALEIKSEVPKEKVSDPTREEVIVISGQYRPKEANSVDKLGASDSNNPIKVDSFEVYDTTRERKGEDMLCNYNSTHGQPVDNLTEKSEITIQVVDLFPPLLLHEVHLANREIAVQSGDSPTENCEIAIQPVNELHAVATGELRPVEAPNKSEFAVGSGIDTCFDVVSESLQEETSEKLNNQRSGADMLVDSSSQYSLEGNWGSVSVISTQSDAQASVDAESLPPTGPQTPREKTGKPITRDPVTGKDMLPPEKLEVFEAPSFMAPFETNQKVNSSEVRKKNEETMAKVTNWSAEKRQSTPLKHLLGEPNEEGKSYSKSTREVLNSAVHKNEAAKIDDANLGVALKKEMAKEWSSPARYPAADGKKGMTKAKRKHLWVPFVCCTSTADI